MAIRVPLRRSSEWSGNDTWPLLLLLVAVLVPTGLLLWFMSGAISRQSAAARQTALEAYRSQLRLLRGRADELWQSCASRLALDTEARPALSASQHFAHLIADEHIDGAIVLDENESVLFPELVSRERLVDADRLLLAAQRLVPGDRVRATRTRELAGLLNDYRVSIPSGQRLFLMSELRRLAPETEFPTQEALRLSTRLVERGIDSHQARGFRQTAVQGIWALTSADRRVIGLYTTPRLQALLDQTLTPLMPRGVRFVAHSPDAPGDDEAITAGASWPGWQLSFVVLDDPAIGSDARTRLFTYLWAGFAGTALLALTGIIAGQALRRQLRLARLKTDLTAAVSHELRAPLASVQVLVDGLLADEKLDPVKTREYLRLIAIEQARLRAVIENFLNFARLDRARQRFDLMPTDPSAIITASVDAIKDRTSAALDLRVDVSSDLPQIMADSDALGTALVNLLDNALKFTPNEKRILVRAYAEGATVVFAVRDNGPGISATEQRRIFRQFYRVDRRLSRETSGVGLGLSIVALVVRAHGGEIEVSSEPGAGSTFALRLPACARDSA